MIDDYIADRMKRDPEFGSASEESQPAAEDTSLQDYLLNGPDLSELDLERDPSPMREVVWHE